MENIRYYDFFPPTCHVFVTLKNKPNKILWILLVPPLQLPEVPGRSPSSLSKYQEPEMLKAQLCSNPPGRQPRSKANRQETRKVPNRSFADMEKFPETF